MHGGDTMNCQKCGTGFVWADVEWDSEEMVTLISPR